MKIIKLVSGPFLAALIYFFLDLAPGNPAVTKMAAVTAWVAAWWLTEAVHLAVTALLPFVLLPLLGILDTKNTAYQYMDQVIFLFMGGFLIALSMERWYLHKRIALKILLHVGSDPSRILAGVMISTYIISMWMSNTATVMMLISAVTAVILQTDKHLTQGKDKLATALLLGLAYAASIGGMATIVGTPTNMIFVSKYNELFPGGNAAGFAKWFVFGAPVSLVLLIICFLILKKMFLGTLRGTKFHLHVFEDEYKKLGRMSFEEKAVTLVFVMTALFWFFRADIDFGAFVIPGWSTLPFFIKPEYIQDSTVAIFMGLLLFFIPSKNEKDKMLMNWEDAKKLPLGIILLFGGGFALAKGFDVSGLSQWLAQSLDFSKDASLWVVIGSICILVTVLSEFASNVASIQLMLPVLVSLTAAMGINPLLLMLPATFAASLGFMLPVATAPNTIVFGTNRIHTSSMMKAGLLIDIAGVILITVSMLTFGRWWWGI